MPVALTLCTVLSVGVNCDGSTTEFLKSDFKRRLEIKDVAGVKPGNDEDIHDAFGGGSGRGVKKAGPGSPLG